MQQDDAFELLSPQQIAEILGLHRRTVQDFLKAGKIQGMKVGKNWKAYRSDVYAYLNTQRQAARERQPLEIHGTGN